MTYVNRASGEATGKGRKTRRLNPPPGSVSAYVAQAWVLVTLRDRDG